MDARKLRGIFGQFASGVTVITCRNGDGAPHGATVTAFTAISLEPALCQVTLTRKSKACQYLSDAPFAVNIPRRRTNRYGHALRRPPARTRTGMGRRTHRATAVRIRGDTVLHAVGRIGRAPRRVPIQSGE